MASVLGHHAGDEFDIDPDVPHFAALLNRGHLERVGVTPAVWCLECDVPQWFETDAAYRAHLPEHAAPATGWTDWPTADYDDD